MKLRKPCGIANGKFVYPPWRVLIADWFIGRWNKLCRIWRAVWS